MTDDPHFPIGRPTSPPEWNATERANRIALIAATPRELRAAVEGWPDTQLDTPYREGGWTVRQLIHYVADSHTQGYTRCKLALTEDNPTVKPIDQDSWAALPDTTTGVDTSLDLLDALHTRWVALLNALTNAQFRRPLRHPDNGQMWLDDLLGYYAWHGPHHIAHVRSLATRMGW